MAPRTDSIRELIWRLSPHLGLLVIPALSFVLAASATFSAPSPAALELVRVIEADDAGPPGLVGLRFPPGTGVRLLLGEPTVGAATNVLVDAGLAIQISDPINLAFLGSVDGSSRLLLFDGTRDELIQVEFSQPGGATPPQVRRVDVSATGVDDPRGLTIDPGSGRIFILDAARRKLVQLDGNGCNLPVRPRHTRAATSRRSICHGAYPGFGESRSTPWTGISISSAPSRRSSTRSTVRAGWYSCATSRHGALWIRGR